MVSHEASRERLARPLQQGSQEKWHTEFLPTRAGQTGSFSPFTPRPKNGASTPIVAAGSTLSTPSRVASQSGVKRCGARWKRDGWCSRRPECGGVLRQSPVTGIRARRATWSYSSHAPNPRAARATLPANGSCGDYFPAALTSSFSPILTRSDVRLFQLRTCSAVVPNFVAMSEIASPRFTV